MLIYSTLLVLAAASGAAQASDGAAVSAQSTDRQAGVETAEARQICRTFPVTGSRTKRQRVCMTADQWQRASEETQSGTRRIIGSEGVCAGGECTGT